MKSMTYTFWNPSIMRFVVFEGHRDIVSAKAAFQKQFGYWPGSPTSVRNYK